MNFAWQLGHLEEGPPLPSGIRSKLWQCRQENCIVILLAQATSLVWTSADYTGSHDKSMLLSLPLLQQNPSVDQVGNLAAVD